MTQPTTTQEKLLLNARRLLWTRGYSNVSVRQIARAAEVDVALISRYFGGKLGLFQATLEGAFDDPTEHAQTTDALMDLTVTLFATTPRGDETPSPLRMILTNAHDDDVGGEVRRCVLEHFYEPLLKLLGSPSKTALFMSVLMGISVMEKTLELPDFPTPQSSEYATQLRHMMQAALTYQGNDT